MVNLYRCFNLPCRHAKTVFTRICAARNLSSRTVASYSVWTLTSTRVFYRLTKSRQQSQLFHDVRHGFHSSLPIYGHVVPFKLSDIGEGIKEVTIKEWFVKVGDKVNQFDQICEVQSDKASVTITSRYDGVVSKVHYEVEEMALVGSPLVDIELDESTSAERDDSLREVQERDAIQLGRTEESIRLPEESLEKILATPAVRRIATEYRVDLKDVQGTGKDGRVLKEDVQNYIDNKNLKSVPEQISSPVTAAQRLPDTDRKEVKTPVSLSVSQTDRKEPIKGYTKTMIKTMTAANNIPHLGYCDEIEITELMTVRTDFQKVGSEHGIRITYMPFFVKSVSLALTQFPVLNSSIDIPNEVVIYKGSHNIGVAMDTKAGLIVPNIKNVQAKSILDIAVELARLHELGLKGTLGPSDLSGGTFTLSNIGSIGGTYAKPVILPPEVCIGAVGKVQTLPRFDVNGNVVRANVFNISWSADHRVVDGATIARFSNLWKSYLENPAAMLLHLK